MASKGDAAAELAEQLIRHLEAQSRLRPLSYPLTVGHLLQLANRDAAPSQVNAAVRPGASEAMSNRIESRLAAFFFSLAPGAGITPTQTLPHRGGGL